MENNEEKYMQELGVKDDEIATLTAEQQVENLKSDVEAYTKALANANKDYDNYKEELDIDYLIWDNITKPGALKKLEPTHEYHKDDEYWRLQELKQKLNIKKEKTQAEATLKQYKSVIENTEKALESSKEKLVRFGGDE
jgi:hypothetical protein